MARSEPAAGASRANRPESPPFLPDMRFSLAPQDLLFQICAPQKGVAVILADDKLATGATAAGLGEGAQDLIRRAAETAGFSGKSKTVLDLLAPAGLGVDRLLVVGLGKADGIAALDDNEWAALGGTVMGKLGKAKAAEVLLETPAGAVEAGHAAAFAMGMKLRAYVFDRYKSKKGDDEETGGSVKVSLLVDDAKAAKKAWPMPMR